LVSRHLRRFQRLMQPELCLMEVAEILVEPAAEFGELTLHLEELSAVGASAIHAQFLDCCDMPTYDGNHLAWAKKIVVIDQHLSRSSQQLHRVVASSS